MRWLIALVLILLSSPVFAQACGPDPAPAQAVSGCPSGSPCYPCQTFRWTCGGGGTGCASGSGDTASEIDSAQTYAPGFKLYWSNGVAPNHTTLIGDYSVDATGKILVKTAVEDNGAFVLTTCGGPNIGASSVWTVGTFFQHGFYAEVSLSYDATGHPSSHTGFYGYDGFWYPDSGNGAHENCPGGGGCYEADDPDALAFNQEIAIHGGGTIFGNSNNPNPLPHLPQTIESNSTWGLLSQPTTMNWYYNGALNGSPGTSAFNNAGSAAGLYNSKQCFGLNSNIAFQTTYNSIKVWQAGPGPPPSVSGGGGTRKLMHRQ